VQETVIEERDLTRIEHSKIQKCRKNPTPYDTNELASIVDPSHLLGPKGYYNYVRDISPNRIDHTL
jgi:hypothetical protein